ncbi:sigma-70 family RNA polymerase sigma factor [Desulfurispirillum indicum]|uniref:sigma-70 family RNA polymerase sigma factor n=1 Tax=Desulfurispirillum indicum TaxID=936456 RepID=UPI001CF945EA|nr:sigma-70 family RNA polymerase sigma factor [Desulfurispirillum indicum]UCZ57320.1 sigma-70 family RNA polymerase sigma factor [Desulfurispirillum indicum]
MRVNTSDQQHLANLYTNHHVWLVNWLRRRLRCVQDADDLAHDTFVRVMGQPEKLEDVREPRAWLSTIARHVVVDHVRRKELELAYAQELAHLRPNQIPCEETRALLLETLARIDAMLEGLNPKIRTTFLLSRLEGFTYLQIASKLGISLSSVEKYMATALRHCMELRHER